jgi:hypothetical protein
MDLQAYRRFRRAINIGAAGIWWCAAWFRCAGFENAVKLDQATRITSGALAFDVTLDLALASREQWRSADGRSGAGMKRFDMIVMFASLWLLASMVLDVLTPQELTVYAIGAALAPATAISALLYWLEVPRIDFAVCFSVLWMVTGMVLELISPVPLSPLMIVVTIVPMVVVGAVINYQCWRRSFAPTAPDAKQAN